MISIIVPVYQAKEYLDRCVKSLVNQSYQDIEIILVDDGSSDGSEKMCDLYAGYDNRIRVIHQVNSGVSVARNAGLDICKGEWVMFVDSDDELDTNACKKSIELADKYSADFSVFCIKNILPNETQNWISMPHEIRVMINDESREQSSEEKEYEAVGLERLILSNCSGINSNYTNFYGPCCKLIKRSLIGRQRFDESLIFGEDTCFMLDLCQRVSRAVYFSDTYYLRYVQEGSLCYGYKVDAWERISRFTNAITKRYGTNESYKTEVDKIIVRNIGKVMANYSSIYIDMPYNMRIKCINTYLKDTQFYKRKIKSKGFGKKENIQMLFLRCHLGWLLGTIMYLLKKVVKK